MVIFLFYRRDRKYPFCQCNIKLEESNTDYKFKYCAGFLLLFLLLIKIEIETKQVKFEHKRDICEFSVAKSLTGISLNLILG